MPYPGHPVLKVLRQFVGTAGPHQSAQQRQQLLDFVSKEYQAGRSLRELAELTGRTQTAIRRALDQAGVSRRGSGAPVTTDMPHRRP